MLLSQEREAWTREKFRLEKALHQAQAQLARLRGEIRTDTMREITGPEADNAALKVSIISPCNVARAAFSQLTVISLCEHLVSWLVIFLFFALRGCMGNI